MSTSDKELLRYDRMVEDALRGVVREAIARVGQFGLPGGHALYITFKTGFPGVDVPERLRGEYPDSMTIVLEHQYWDLVTEAQSFSVALSFKGRREHLGVPYAAITAFHDPGVQFGLRFDELAEAQAKAAAERAGGKSGAPDKPASDRPGADKPSAEKSADKPGKPAEPPKPATADIVSLDAFRKK